MDEPGLKWVGDYSSGFPSVTFPDIPFALRALSESPAKRLISSVESITAAHKYNYRGDQIPPANQEVLSFGKANRSSGFVTAVPAGNRI